MTALMNAIALGATVALLVTTAYFIMGSVPLLVLKHDTPIDARFVRAFFNVYYRAAFVSAGVTAASFALAGHEAVAAGAAALALIAVGLRRRILPKMDSLGTQIQSADVEAIPGFRRLHVIAILVNIAQLVAIVGCLIGMSRAQMHPATAALHDVQPMAVAAV
jgi:hypothetical protein